MAETPYIDDGNPVLYEKKLVDPKNKENNEYPMYITSFKKGYGPKQKVVDKNMQIVNEELNDTYWSRGVGKQILQTTINDGKTIVLCEALFPGEEYVIPMIISLMKRNYSVIYLPKVCSTDCYLNLINNKRHDLELVFIPDLQRMTHMLKPVIDLSQPIYFRNTSELSLMDKALSMYNSLDEFSHSLEHGNYQVVSRIRIGYALKSQGEPTSENDLPCIRSKSPTSVTDALVVDTDNKENTLNVNIQTGGRDTGVSNKAIDEYIEGQNIMYGSGKQRKHAIKNKTKKRRKTKRNKMKKLKNTKKRR